VQQINSVSVLFISGVLESVEKSRTSPVIGERTPNVARLPRIHGANAMQPIRFGDPATAAAAEAAGNSTLILLLLAHLQERGLIDPATLGGMIEQAERNTRRDTPVLAGSSVISHTLAWLQAQAA
jgi:hypothetical protein